jgi:hypothetical protein
VFSNEILLSVRSSGATRTDLFKYRTAFLYGVRVIILALDRSCEMGQMRLIIDKFTKANPNKRDNSYYHALKFAILSMQILLIHYQ